MAIRLNPFLRVTVQTAVQHHESRRIGIEHNFWRPRTRPRFPQTQAHIIEVKLKLNPRVAALGPLQLC